MKNLPQFIDRQALAEILGVSVRTLIRKRDEYPFNTAVQIGRCVRYPVSVLDLLKTGAESKVCAMEGASNDRN